MHESPIDTAATSERGPMLTVAISGLLYFAGFLLPQVDGPPVETATAAQIRSFLADHDTGLRVTATAGALAIALVLVFTVSLARLIRQRSAGSPLADLVVGGGVLVALWHWLVVAGASLTLVQTLDGTDLATVNDATLRSWYGITNFTHIFADLGMVAIATVMAATSIAALRTGLSRAGSAGSGWSSQPAARSGRPASRSPGGHSRTSGSSASSAGRSGH